MLQSTGCQYIGKPRCLLRQSHLAFEVCTQDSFQVSWLNCTKCLSSEKDLLQRSTPESEMEEEQLHQARLGIRSENLFEAINTKRPLIQEPRRRTTSVRLRKLRIYLVAVRNYRPLEADLSTLT